MAWYGGAAADQTIISIADGLLDASDEAESRLAVLLRRVASRLTEVARLPYPRAADSVDASPTVASTSEAREPPVTQVSPEAWYSTGYTVDEAAEDDDL